MSEYFSENNKFLGLNGILDRRNFIVNCLLIEIFEAIFYLTPFTYLLVSKPEMLSAFQSGNKPQLFVIAMCILGIFSSVFYFSNFVRRIRDIIAEEDNNKIYLIAAVLSVLEFMGYTPVGDIFFGKFIGFFIILYLIFTKGKISGEKPKSAIFKFNWGAFFGTWIWGLFNKAPITLFMIPLLCTTTGWFPFMLICGIKGNEWSYEKQKEKLDNIEAFHKSQSNQALVFTLLAPILSLIFFIILSIGVGITIFKYTKSNPEHSQKMIQHFKNYQTKLIEASFNKIEYSDGVYNFYIKPQDWKSFSKYLKHSTFKNADNYVLIKSEVYEQVMKGDYKTHYKYLNKVKILSTFNNEILAECNFPDEKIEKTVEKIEKMEKESTTTNQKAVVNELSTACKYNYNPTLP